MYIFHEISDLKFVPLRPSNSMRPINDLRYLLLRSLLLRIYRVMQIEKKKTMMIIHDSELSSTHILPVGCRPCCPSG